MKNKSLISIILIILFIIFWFLLLQFFTPKELIDLLGIHNGYIISFFVALFGGVVIFTFVSVYPLIFTFALGGLNPLLLGVIAGAGLTLGNLLYFYLGRHSRDVLIEKLSKREKKFLDWLKHEPHWIVQIIIFVYVGLTPLPNNLLTVICGLTGYRIKSLIWPLLLGNILLLSLLSYLAVLGILLF